MDPYTSRSRAARTFPAAAVVEHGHQPSVPVPSHLSPALFSPAPSPGLLPASGSGSAGSYWFQQQVAPSPAGNGSLPSPFFPTTGTLPTAGYDLFCHPGATAATPPLPTLLGAGRREGGESSSSASSSVRRLDCPSPGLLFGFAGQAAASWPSEGTSPFFPPSSATSGMVMQSGDNLVGFTTEPSLDSELEALVLAVDEIPVDAPMPPIEEEGEEEEIDVSDFLVSDPEDLPPNPSWSASPAMAAGSGGGGASASWMAPGRTGNNWPPTFDPVVASMCTGNNWLPVKQEVMDVDAPARWRHPPDFISLVDYEDGDDGCNNVFAGSWGSSSSPGGFAPGTWLGSSPSFASSSSSWGGGTTGSPSFAPSTWGGGGGGGSSSSHNFAGSTACFDQSISIDIYGSTSMTNNLSIGGKMPSNSALPPLPKLSGSSSRGGAAIVFTDPEKAIIASEKKLQELVRTDPKKVKRILYNRTYSKVAKVRKVMHTKNLEQLVATLEERRKTLSAELQSLEGDSATLMAQKTEMQMVIAELEHQALIKDAAREGLRAQIQNLKYLDDLN